MIKVDEGWKDEVETNLILQDREFCDFVMYFLLLRLQEELDGMAAKYPDSFKIYYVLNQVCLLILFKHYPYY